MGYAKVESLSIAELNDFVITAPSQEIDFICTKSDWDKDEEGMVLYFFLKLCQETSAHCLIFHMSALQQY